MQKIMPFLWFDTNAEEAVNLYTSLFPDSEIENIQKYPQGSDDPQMKNMEGKVLTAVFNLAGLRFMALDGGQVFRKNPSVSFSVSCDSVEEVEKYWNAFSENGIIRMPLDTYPFSEKYGWCDDKFGTSWQISLGESEQKIIPSLMFVQDVAGKAHEAIQMYTSLFPHSQIDLTVPYEPGESENEKAGSLKYSQFTLAGQKFVAMDSGMDHKFTFSEGVSLFVDCQDQEEVDRLWNLLTAGGGEESMCGWLKDKYGLSWQIIPKQLGEMMSDSDPEKASRVMQAMLQMNKIDIAKLEQAYNNQ
jgi:predicted 3-demethylubiquinone-9 3-methyltransferase (glyoxalase superfamily)